MTDTVMARRPAKKPDGALSAPHAPAPQSTAQALRATVPAPAQACVAALDGVSAPLAIFRGSAAALALSARYSA